MRPMLDRTARTGVGVESVSISVRSTVLRSIRARMLMFKGQR